MAAPPSFYHQHHSQMIVFPKSITDARSHIGRAWILLWSTAWKPLLYNESKAVFKSPMWWEQCWPRARLKEGKDASLHHSSLSAPFKSFPTWTQGLAFSRMFHWVFNNLPEEFNAFGIKSKIKLESLIFLIFGRNVKRPSPFGVWKVSFYSPWLNPYFYCGWWNWGCRAHIWLCSELIPGSTYSWWYSGERIAKASVLGI